MPSPPEPCRRLAKLSTVLSKPCPRSETPSTSSESVLEKSNLPEASSIMSPGCASISAVCNSCWTLGPGAIETIRGRFGDSACDAATKKLAAAKAAASSRRHDAQHETAQGVRCGLTNL